MRWERFKLSKSSQAAFADSQAEAILLFEKRARRLSNAVFWMDWIVPSSSNMYCWSERTSADRNERAILKKKATLPDLFQSVGLYPQRAGRSK